MSAVGVMDLARALRELQTDFRLDEVSARMVLPSGSLTIRFTGVRTPLGVIEDEQGHTVAINVP
jgi:hypothetical protein